jgi:hypothetical protein
MIMNNEPEKGLVYPKVVSDHIPQETEENHKSLP